MAEDTKNVKFHEEVQKMEYEPLDATELKLTIGAGLSACSCSWLSISSATSLLPAPTAKPSA